MRAHGFQDFLAAGLDDLLINAALVRREFAENGDLFQFLRKIGGDLFLEPEKQEGPQSPRQAGLGFSIFSRGVMGSS